MTAGTKMNDCDEYQAAIAAEPSFDGGAGHLAGCRDCQAWRQEMLALNARIERALRLEVPELTIPELPAIDTDKVATLAGRRRFTAPAWLAVAASFAIAAVIGVRMFGAGAALDPEALGEEVLAHVYHEPSAMEVSTAAVSDEVLHDVVSDDVAAIDHSAGLITYAHSCVINGHEVPHLVIQGARGPVMILLMPEERVGKAIHIANEHNAGVILPVGDGSIAIVGSPNEDLEGIERSIRSSVMWRT